MYLFNPKSGPKNPFTEHSLFYPGDLDFSKLTTVAAYQRYEDLCNGLVKAIIEMLRKPCKDYKALTHEILRVIAQESKKIAVICGFQEKFCQLRTAPPVESQLKDIWSDNIQEEMQVKITMIKDEMAKSVKTKYILYCFEKIATACQKKQYNSIKQEPGLLQGSFRSGDSRYTLKLFSQTSLRFKHKQSGKTEELPLNEGLHKYQQIDPKQYNITPHYKHLDEAIENVVNAGMFNGVSTKDILVGEIEILHNNIWFPLTRHLTARDNGADFLNEEMPCALVRCEIDVVDPLVEILANHLEKLHKLEPNKMDELHNHTAAIIYLLEQCCPYLTANVHATRIFTAACYGFHELKLVYSNTLNDVFLTAMHAPWLDIYVKKTSAVLKNSMVTHPELQSAPPIMARPKPGSSS